MLIKRNANGGVPTVFDELHDMMNNAFNDGAFGPEFTKNFFGIDFNKQSYPKTDLIDDGDCVLFEVEIHGLTKDDVSVDLEPSDNRNESYLVISGGKKETDKNDKRNYIRKEIKRSAWRRSWVLYEDQYDVSKIKADVKDGMLVVSVAKVKDQKKKSTKIL